VAPLPAGGTRYAAAPAQLTHWEAPTWPGAPYVPVSLVPVSLERVFVDQELDQEGFTYVLTSGREGTVHIKQVLEYNQPASNTLNLVIFHQIISTHGE
jgi:hypothetical protein